MGVVLLVLGIVAGVGLIQAAIWIPLVRSWRRKARQFESDLDAEIEASGERVVIAREKAVYRGCSGSYGAVKGNGTIVLTDRRLVFRKLTGGVVEVPVAKMLSTHETASFLGSRVGGQVHLVIATNDPAELGFFVSDLPKWEVALATGEGAGPAT